MKNKSWSRLLSGLLVIAMLLSITAMPAYATGKNSAGRTNSLQTTATASARR